LAENKYAHVISVPLGTQRFVYHIPKGTSDAAMDTLLPTSCPTGHSACQNIDKFFIFHSLCTPCNSSNFW